MSSPLAVFRHALSAAVAAIFALDEDDRAALERSLRVPKHGEGDLALPCFTLAQILDKPKGEIQALAEQVADALGSDERWASVEAAGPYVNVTYATPRLAEAVVPRAREAAYGTSDAGAAKTVCIDFSSPNIAKPLAFHHIRSTVIGAAIGNLHRAQGWSVVGINYLGDWGKQFGLLATGFQRYGDPARRADAKHLVEVYVKANREADVGRVKATMAAPTAARALVTELQNAHAGLTSEAEATYADQKKLGKKVRSLEKRLRGMRGITDSSVDPLDGCAQWLRRLQDEADAAAAELPEVEARDDEARGFLKRMEEGDQEALAEWQEFRRTSIEAFERVYARMGITFTSLEGESAYQDVLEQTVQAIRDTAGTRVDQGAEVVDMPYGKGEPPAIVRTRDGTTLYLTRDIAAARDRFARFEFDRSLYVVAQDQALHFRQLFRALDAMGQSWAGRCEHVPFGRVHGMSTRRGRVVFLDEVLEEACDKAREICAQSDKIAPEHLDEAVEAIGVGAIVFGDLRNLRTSDYTFDWAQVLDFSGHTAPYVQFSHARACSILRKAGGAPDTADVTRLVLPEERNLIVALGGYPEAVEKACEDLEPSIVTRALLDIAGATASYLTAGNRERQMRVLVDGDDDLRAARLHLVDGVRHCLKHGLGLLGCRAPEAM